MRTNNRNQNRKANHRTSKPRPKKGTSSVREQRERVRNHAEITDIDVARRESSRIRRRANSNRRWGEWNSRMMWSFIFVGILFYFIYSFFRYLADDSVAGYQVVAGSLSLDTTYRGIAIRQEEEFQAFDAGYINYYASEGLKAGCGNMIYTLDATGELSSILEDTETNRMTDDELSVIQNDILNFKNEYSEYQFNDVYHFQNNLNSLISRYRTKNIMDNISALNESQSASVGLIRAEKAGIVVYKHDGYENLTKETVTMADLDASSYEPVLYTSNSLVASGDVVYKMITSEDWCIAIGIDDTVAQKLANQSYIEVKFLKTQETSWAGMEIKRTPDGCMLFLSFHNSVITFCNDRYVDIELIMNNEEGLKIPNSAIREKEFYLVPVEFVTKGGDAMKTGVLLEQYGEDGNVDYVFREVEIYSETDSYYYISSDSLDPGDYILLPDEPVRAADGMMDAEEIKDRFEPEQTSSVGVPSFIAGENDVNINEDGLGELAEGQKTSENTSSKKDGTTTSEAAGDTSSSEGEATQEDGSLEDGNTEKSEGENQTGQDATTDPSQEESADSTEDDPLLALVRSNVKDNRYVISAKSSLIGVYNMNKGYADFRQITILYQNDEYAIIRPNTNYGLQEYDYIVLNAKNITDNDLTY